MHISSIFPLKALINDQLIRMESICKDNDICTVPWHGDVPIHVKNRLDNNNQAILLITPESLEAMLSIILIKHVLYLKIPYQLLSTNFILFWK